MAEKQQTKEEIIAEIMEQQRTREVLLRTNKVDIAGVILEISQLDKSPKKDKKGNLILDDNNQPTFYDDMFWCTIGVLGSEEGVLLSSEQVNNVDVNNTYMFSGRMKNRKFKCDTITLL